MLSNKYIYVVNGYCIPCGGTNLQQGPTTVKSDTGASVHSTASSPHTTPTPNQDDPSRDYSDVGNTLATVFPPQPTPAPMLKKVSNASGYGGKGKKAGRPAIEPKELAGLPSLSAMLRRNSME